MKPQTGLVRLVDYKGYVNSYSRNVSLIKQYFNSDSTINIEYIQGDKFASGHVDKEATLCIIDSYEWKYFEPVIKEVTKPKTFTHKLLAISEYEELVNIKAKYDKIVNVINS